VGENERGERGEGEREGGDVLIHFLFCTYFCFIPYYLMDGYSIFRAFNLN